MEIILFVTIMLLFVLLKNEYVIKKRLEKEELLDKRRQFRPKKQKKFKSSSRKRNYRM
jgi:Na+/H+ antiporter NhaD/arsenite permease-like protein